LNLVVHLEQGAERRDPTKRLQAAGYLSARWIFALNLVVPIDQALKEEILPKACSVKLAA
jgi:hypothetical protein